jgi:glycosyltransferase involved in cell wall biosynthesis
MKKYKVAYLGLKGIPAISGADRVAEGLVNHLSEHYDITIYCKKGYSNIQRIGNNIHQVIIRTVPIKNLDMFLYFFFSALHACFIKRYDLVHVHNIDCAYILPLLKIFYRSHILSTSHGSPYEREKWSPFAKKFFHYMERIFIYYSPNITSVALPLKDYYESAYDVKVKYIPNGVQVSESILPRSKVSDDGYILFAAGRILPSKGCHIFLEAISKCGYQGQVLVIGDLSQMTGYSRDLRSMAPAKTRFIELIKSKTELMKYVSAAKIFIFPSTYEAASMMLLEAVSQGVPVISSDIPENTVLLDNPNALFFKSGSAEDLSEKIMWVLGNYQTALEYAGRLQLYVEKNYAWGQIAHSYSKLYFKILNDCN